MSEYSIETIIHFLTSLSCENPEHIEDDLFDVVVDDNNYRCDISITGLAGQAAAQLSALKEENRLANYAADVADKCREEWREKAVRYAAEIDALKKENERLAGEHKLLRERLHLANSIIDDQDPITATLKARVAELEKERQTLADAAYSAIIAFNNLQDESLDGEARAHALLKHTDCIRNLWNIFATQDNARFKEPANEG